MARNARDPICVYGRHIPDSKMLLLFKAYYPGSNLGPFIVDLVFWRVCCMLCVAYSELLVVFLWQCSNSVTRVTISLSKNSLFSQRKLGHVGHAMDATVVGWMIYRGLNYR